FESFYYFAENGVFAIEVACRFTRVADEELRAAGVTAGMGHGKNTTVVVLVVAVEFTLDRVSGATVSNTVGTAALNDEIGDDAVERKTIVKSLLCKGYEILYGVGSIFFEEFDLHY